MDLSVDKLKKIQGRGKGLIYPYIATMPPWIIMFYLYTKNAMYINYWHTFVVTAIFSTIGFVFYLTAVRIGKSPGRAAFLSVACWVSIFAMRPLYATLTNWGLTKDLRLSLTILGSFFCIIVVFLLSKIYARKEIFQLFAIFETTIFLLNFIPATFSFITNKGEGLSYTLTSNNFNIDPASQSPNIYWIFTDGMLGFNGMEKLFGESQRELSTALERRGFIINKNAQFESFHATKRAVPSLMCPGYYDKIFLPIVRNAHLMNYTDKKNSLEKIDPVVARLNNELIAAFNAKGYVTNTLSGFDTHFWPTTTYYFTQRKVITNEVDTIQNPQTFKSKAELYQLQSLLYTSCMPVALLTQLFTGDNVTVFDNDNEKNKIFGKEYRGDDAWQIDTLNQVFTEPAPHFTIIHNVLAHYPFALSESGASVFRTELENLNPVNYPPQHHYAAKVYLGYIDLILEHDPDAVIILQADHGLHAEETREALLIAGGTDEDVRIMQNSVMSAVRIPQQWGGLDTPLDPLNISRILINRFVGENYTLLENHP
jgi:hypothetical protein